MSNIHHYKSSVNGRTAEHNLASETLTVFEGGSILVELHVPAGTTPGAIWNHIEADYEAMYAEAEAMIAAAPAPVAAPAAPKMKIGVRFDWEAYPLRGHPGRKSDWVTRFFRNINGKAFEFTRVQWANGVTTIRVYAPGSTDPIHTFHI